MTTITAVPIGELARRSGFSTHTLRYYERLGLLPPPARTDSGRRAFDARALDRLRFIKRAKELGCSLGEVRSLLSAYDADCSVVQTKLRALVEDKISDAQRRAAELIVFTAQLHQARHALAGEGASGPCGPSCTCIDRGALGKQSLAVVPWSAADRAIACTLDHAEMGERVREWQAVLDQVTERSPVDGGIRLTLDDAADLGEVTRLARAEWGCCSFFSFAITVDDRGAALEVRAPSDARNLLTSVFGVAG